jgi:organic hydroperoxide reductase OsmC/OhrA
MKPYPHVYPVSARMAATGTALLQAEGMPDLPSAAPREFDGPGDQWSPESLLVAAVASCFLLTFKAMARASKLEWSQLDCSVEGTLERVDGMTQFSHMHTRARLTAPRSSSNELCLRLLKKAERGCLVANSLRCARDLTSDIVQV